MALDAVRGGPAPAVMMVVMMLVSACAVAPPPEQPPPEPQPVAGPVGADPLAAAVIAESNRARAADGAGPLIGDPALQRAAQAHADELAERGVLDHGSPTPGRHTLAERIRASDVSFREAGENLAKLHARTDDVARAAIRMWLMSEGHRLNLLRRSYTHTGVGVARDGRGNSYVVQLYVLPFGDSP